jgi:hypothetical protein
MKHVAAQHVTPLEGLGSILAAAQVAPLRKVLAVANLRPSINPPTAKNLAGLLGCTRTHLVKVVEGERPSDRVWQGLSGLLGVPEAWLRGEPALVEASAGGDDLMARIS